MQTGRLSSGVVPLLAYAALTAAMDVYGGNRLQVVSPESLAAVSFTFTAAFFIALEILRPGGGASRLFRGQLYDIVAINVTTVVTWMATFLALRNLEPAVVNVVGLGLAPVFTVLTGPLLRRGSSMIAAEVAVAVGICVFLGVLVWGSFAGETAVGRTDPSRVMWGVVFSVLCAIGSAANIIYMKRLGEAGYKPESVLAVRFLLMVVVGWSVTAFVSRSDVGRAILPGAVVAVIGIGVPVFVLQLGIRHTEPITTSLLVSLSPLFAYVMQFLDGRLRPSVLTIVGIVGVVLLAAVGTFARDRHDKRYRLTVAPDPQPPGLTDAITGRSEGFLA